MLRYAKLKKGVQPVYSCTTLSLYFVFECPMDKKAGLDPHTDLDTLFCYIEFEPDRNEFIGVDYIESVDLDQLMNK